MAPAQRVPAPGGAVQAADRSIRRLIAVVVPLWLAGIAATALGHPAGTPPVAAALGVLVVAAGYAAYLARGPAAILGLTGVGSALGVAAASPPVAAIAAFPVAAPWLTMATSVTGALVLSRLGPLLVLGVAAAGGVAIAVDTPSDGLAVSAVIAQALVGGWCMWVVLGTLRAGARHSDDAAAELALDETRRACESARVAEVQRTARQLHDTVINTLGAIRGLPITDPALVRERCAADLAELSRSEPPDPSVSEMFNRLSARARLLGLRLTVQASGIGSLPEPVAEALEGAMLEALVNCAKHAGSPHVHLTWQWDGATGTAELADEGRGFGTARLTGGGAQSILTRCQEAGIRVSLSDRGGAVIRWAWSAVPPATPAPPVPLDPVMGNAAGRVATVIAAFGVYATAVTPEQLGRAGSIAALALLCALIAWAAIVTRVPGTSQLPWPVYAAMALAVTVLPAVGLSGCARVGWFWWGPLAGLGLLLCVVLIDGRAVAVVSALAGFTAAFVAVLTGTPGMTGPCSSGTTAGLALCLGIVGALLSFRTALAAHWAEAVRARGLADEGALRDAERSVRRAVRERELSRALQVSSPVLAGIAEGRLDPADPSVRSACGRAEGILRAVMTLGPEHGPIAEELAAVVLLAGARGISVRVRVDGDLPTPASVVAGLSGTLRQWVSTIPPRAIVRLTALGIAGEGLLVATCTPPVPLPADTPTEWSVSEDDGEVGVEARWDASGWVGADERLRVTAG